MRRLHSPLVMFAFCAHTGLVLAEEALPTLMSTNICADMLALKLAAPEQILSLSKQSHDAQRFSMAQAAKKYTANTASAEDVLMLKPQLVLASRRWSARQPMALHQRYGVRMVNIPFPTDWPTILRSTQDIGTAMGRTQQAQQLVAELEQRLQALHHTSRPYKALYLRPNGGSAGVNTHVDAVLEAAGLRNHAGALGLKGWGTIDLERIVQNPPDIFITPSIANDTAYARSVLSRHPQMRALLKRIPVVALQHNDWGCSNWLLVEAAEAVAQQIDALQHAALVPQRTGAHE